MRYSLIILFALFSFSWLCGQTSKGVKQKIMEEKKAFFTKELALSKAEQNAFWPLYNDYQNRRTKIVAEKRNLLKYYSQNAKNISTDEASDILDRYLGFEKAETRLLEDYTQKFKDILSDEKVLKIYITEIKFKDYLLKRLRTD